MRLDIAYRLRFRFSEPVWESHNEVRVRPRDDDRQRLLGYHLSADPPARVLSALDYWGTSVDHVGLRAPHTEMALTADAAVETQPRAPMTASPERAAVADERFRWEHLEFLEPSEHVDWQPDDAVERSAARVAGMARTVPETVAAITGEVRRVLRYEPGSTEIGVSLGQLLDGGAGVCQDFAHLAIGMLRSVGVPARYVSGYLFAADESAPAEADARAAGETAPAEAAASGRVAVAGDGGIEAVERVSVQTHAWIEAAVPGWGWWAVDPTNGGVVGERHVVIGWGRDYRDVAPVRGVFMGAAAVEVDAEVVIGKHAEPSVERRPTARASGGRPGSVEARHAAADPPPAHWARRARLPTTVSNLIHSAEGWSAGPT